MPVICTATPSSGTSPTCTTPSLFASTKTRPRNDEKRALRRSCSPGHCCFSGGNRQGRNRIAAEGVAHGPAKGRTSGLRTIQVSSRLCLGQRINTGREAAEAIRAVGGGRGKERDRFTENCAAGERDHFATEPAITRVETAAGVHILINEARDRARIHDEALRVLRGLRVLIEKVRRPHSRHSRDRRLHRARS